MYNALHRPECPGHPWLRPYEVHETSEGLRFDTEEEAEYPWDFCVAYAKALKQVVSAMAPAPVGSLGRDTKTELFSVIKRATRGLQNPVLAMKVATKVDQVLKRMRPGDEAEHLADLLRQVTTRGCDIKLFTDPEDGSLSVMAPYPAFAWVQVQWQINRSLSFLVKNRHIWPFMISEYWSQFGGISGGTLQTSITALSSGESPSDCGPFCLGGRRTSNDRPEDLDCHSVEATLQANTAVVKAMLSSRQKGESPWPGHGPPPETRKLYAAEILAVAQGESGDWAYGHWTSGCAYELTAIVSVAGAIVLAELPATSVHLSCNQPCTWSMTKHESFIVQIQIRLESYRYSVD
eukprot:Skav233625  [mRNA]  locus=scaffold492:3166:11578:+ [translate_table: standard]